MSIGRVTSRTVLGIEALEVQIEVHISQGLPKLSIVGLPETLVKESKERVRSAIMSSHFHFPNRRITINLAPAQLPKQGAHFDLPIALGILAAAKQIPAEKLTQYEFMGELALDGTLRATSDCLPIAIAAQKSARALILPPCHASLARISHAKLYTASHLLEVCNHLHTDAPLTLLDPSLAEMPQLPDDGVDLSELIGIEFGKRALEIAASGGHNLLFVGPPGCGKTSLATRFRTILPLLTEQEAQESAVIHTQSTQGFQAQNYFVRPLRHPHHSASMVSLVGGGSPIKPGEISLAHHGILFLDELPEFSRASLESLREPLEKGSISIARASERVNFPARFQLIAAMNPCPCGYANDPSRYCQCSDLQKQRYLARLSGPLLDRIDLQIYLSSQRSPFSLRTTKAESSSQIRMRVSHAHQIQIKRQQCLNAHLPDSALAVYCSLSHDCEQLLQQFMARHYLSMRALHRISRVARTLADMSANRDILPIHLAEALSYRHMTDSLLMQPVTE